MSLKYSESESNNYFNELIIEIRKIDYKQLDIISNTLFEFWKNQKNVWVAGNGGNSATAQHYATDWSKGCFISTGKAMKVRALSENSALISAISNDLPIENMFVFQLQMFAKQGDLVVLLSAGGNSQNIKKAAAYCQENNIFSIGLIGGIEPDLGNCFNLELHINSVNLQIVEDIHEIIGHIVFEKIKKLGNE